MLSAGILYIGFYIIMGLICSIIYGGANESEPKATALILFWPIIGILNSVRFLKYSINGLREWFK